MDVALGNTVVVGENSGDGVSTGLAFRLDIPQALIAIKIMLMLPPIAHFKMD